MDKIIVRGGQRLAGETYVSGAKNAALPLLAASLLAEGEHTFRNVPDLLDVSTMLKVLRTMGCQADRLQGGKRHNCKVRVGSVTPEAPSQLVKTMGGSVLGLGPLVARHGRARVWLPGGCAIGARPIDQHLKGLEAMGCTIRLDRGYVIAEGPAGGGRLRGAEVCF